MYILEAIPHGLIFWEEENWATLHWVQSISKKNHDWELHVFALLQQAQELKMLYTLTPTWHTILTYKHTNLEEWPHDVESWRNGLKHNYTLFKNKCPIIY